MAKTKSRQVGKFLLADECCMQLGNRDTISLFRSHGIDVVGGIGLKGSLFDAWSGQSDEANYKQCAELGFGIITQNFSHYVAEWNKNKTKIPVVGISDAMANVPEIFVFAIKKIKAELKDKDFLPAKPIDVSEYFGGSSLTPEKLMKMLQKREVSTELIRYLECNKDGPGFCSACRRFCEKRFRGFGSSCAKRN